MSTCGGKRLKGALAEGSAEQPLVTVVTAVYNGKGDVARCLESVLSQDYPSIEHIVLDGGSIDGTVEVLRQWDDRIALWRSEPDKGVYDAWNKALVEARGEWICFLGVDDEFLPNAVSAYMALAARSPEAEYISSRVKWVHPSGYEKIFGEPWAWKRFSKSMSTAHVGSMHHRSLFDRLGKYDISYRFVADYEFLLRAKNDLNAEFLPVVTVTMKAGGVSDSRAALKERARALVASGARSKIFSEVGLFVANAKFTLRPLKYVFRRLTSR
jgi:glycosyltransferase involved in cell wall biosynthesis